MTPKTAASKRPRRENIEVYLSKIVATTPQYELSVPEGLDISNSEYYDAITKNADGSYSIAISDPTQTYSSLTLSIVIEGISEVTSTDAGVSATISGSTLNISVSSASSLGSAFNLTVK